MLAPLLLGEFVDWPMDRIMDYMYERCEVCGELLNNSPDCDPEINGGKGCANELVDNG